MSRIRRSARGERSYVQWGGIAAVATLMLAGCGANKEVTTVVSPQYTSEGSGTQTFDPSTISPRREGSVLVFSAPEPRDESSVVRAYVGPDDTPSDKKVVATFPTGDSAPAECKVEGRLMHANTPAGQEIASDEWVRIKAVGYVAAVHAQYPGSLLPQLLEC